MKTIERHHKRVAWSDEDDTCIGECADVITGIHRDEPIDFYRELSEPVDEVLAHFEQEWRPLQPARFRPTQEVS